MIPNLFHFLLFPAMFLTFNTTLQDQLRFGVFADCQYCDCETAGTRYYRNSPEKLRKCIGAFNKNKDLAFVAGLGDLIDRDLESYSPLKAILRQSKHPVHHVIGNHDSEVDKKFLDQIPEQLGLTRTYYTVKKANWLFIFLNGNEVTFQTNDPLTEKKAEEMLQKLKAANKPNSYSWNGGMSRKQIQWLDQQLEKSAAKNLRVGLFCHYPLLPLEAHTLWNSEEVLEVLQKYDHVKFWMNGHNHAGNYASRHGIHFITLKGMVETENQNAFAEVLLNSNSLQIKGYEREKSRIFEW